MRNTINCESLTLSLLDMENIFYIYLYMVWIVSFLPHPIFVFIPNLTTALWRSLLRPDVAWAFCGPQSLTYPGPFAASGDRCVRPIGRGVKRVWFWLKSLILNDFYSGDPKCWHLLTSPKKTTLFQGITDVTTAPNGPKWGRPCWLLLAFVNMRNRVFTQAQTELRKPQRHFVVYAIKRNLFTSKCTLNQTIEV